MCKSRVSVRARPWQDRLDSAPTLRALTRQDLQALAQRYFVEDRLIRVHILPASKAEEAKKR